MRFSEFSVGFLVMQLKGKKHDKDENGEPMDAFEEMLKVMDVENLIRFRHRLKRVGRKRMVELLSEEIQERETHLSASD